MMFMEEDRNLSNSLSFMIGIYGFYQNIELFHTFKTPSKLDSLRLRYQLLFKAKFEILIDTYTHLF